MSEYPAWRDRMEARGDLFRDGECHIWMGQTDDQGYGRVWDQGRARGVRVVAYERGGKTVPPGCILRSACGTKGCVKPSHQQPVARRAVGLALAAMPKERDPATGQYHAVPPQASQDY